MRAVAEPAAEPREVLIVTINYWPEVSGIGPYSTELAEHLASIGHRVTVLTGMPHYPQWRIDEAYRGRLRVEQMRAGVRLLRRWHTVPTRQSALKRGVYEGTFVLNAALLMPPHRPDAIIGIVPSLGGGVLARILAQRTRAAYGLILQDLMGPAASQSGIPGGRSAAAVARRLERWMLARATVVAPVAHAFVPYLSELGVSTESIEVVPNWSRLAAASGGRADKRRSLGWQDDELIALHAGNMGSKQGLEQLVEAAREVEERGLRIRFVLMGDGNQRDHLKRIAAGSKRVEFRPFAEGAELPEILAAADVLMVSERPSVHDMSLPSKLTAYFAAGRPIVAAVHPDGATAREIGQVEGGVVVEAGNPKQLIDALLALQLEPDRVARMVSRARLYARSALNRDVILAQHANIVERMARRTMATRHFGGGT